MVGLSRTVLLEKSFLTSSPDRAPTWQLPLHRTHNAHGLTWVWFGLIPVRSPLLGKSSLLSIPQGTKMCQFPWLSFAPYAFRCECRGMTRDPSPDSEISGSMLAYQLPGAYRRRATSFIGF
jgi:hypothetical protein